MNLQGLRFKKTKISPTFKQKFKEEVIRKREKSFLVVIAPTDGKEGVNDGGGLPVPI